ncbi:adenylate/guanylate cyclase domain-containing protein [Candidatus Woesearchaeota archaeon]|jgi:adenylate cyclase|nr:adenylate/guanylate cyclase domain-containing protein [Candidatus Woesearchaeota archaeon]
MVPRKIHSEILTVLLIDLVDYTRQMSKADREKIHEIQDVLDALALPQFSHYGGKVIKKMGDAFLVTFRSATNAVLCGVALQTKFYEYSRKREYKLQIKVALHAGEVVHRNGDVYGDTINTTARIEGITKPGHIVFSEAVYLAMNQNEIPYLHLGLKKLKGLRRPVRLFRVKRVYDKILQRRLAWERRRKRLFRWLFTLVLIIILTSVGLYLYRNVFPLV